MKKRMTFIKKMKTEKGQSLVELALALTFLLVLVAGSVDLGRVFIAYISLRDAAQEGIAFGSVFPTYCNQIVARTVSSSSNMFQPTAGMVTVYIGGATCASASPEQACIGQDITINISNPAYPITMPFFGSIIGTQTIPMEVEVSDTILRPPCP
jgi:hypothetical protein